MAGGAGGLARDWLHRGVHQLVADRGVHSDFADGWRAGPLVSGIRHRAVGSDPHLHAGVLDHHAHDVCRLVAAPFAPAGAQACFLGAAVPALTGLVAAPSARAVADLGGHGGFERQPLPKHSQRLFPAAGHGPHFWLDPRRPKQFLSVHAAAPGPVHGDCAGRPCRGARDRLHRRRAAQCRANVCVPQAAQRA